MNPTYELMVIVDSDLSDDQIQTEIKSIEEHLAESSFEIKSKDEMGLRDFAYHIKKKERGYYCIFYGELAPEKVKEIENFLRLARHILRFLIIRLPKDQNYTPLTEREKRERAAAPVTPGITPKTSEKISSEAAPSPKKVFHPTKAKTAPKSEIEPLSETSAPPLESKSESPKKPEDEEMPATETPPSPETPPTSHSDRESLKKLDEELDKFLKNPDLNV